MEIHRQQCQNCGHRELVNYISRDNEDRIFTQCAKCKKLVARYILADGGYFHVGRGFESFLRNLSRQSDTASVRDVKIHFEAMEKESLAQFEKVLELYGPHED